MNLVKWSCAEFLHPDFVSVKVEMQNVCIIYLLLLFLMNLAEKWLCRIFAYRFCKCQSWNAEFLHYPFVVDFLVNLVGKWLCRIFASRFCKCQSWNAEFLHYLFVVDFLMNLTEIWLCKNIFASNRFLSWNAEFLHDPCFVVDFVMNLAGKWLCRIFASSLQVKMQNFCIIHICYNYFLWFFSAVISP